MKVLFITRKYPPRIGGMESFSYGLISNFPGEKEVITYSGSQKWLIFIYFYFLFRALSVIYRKKIDLIHLGDAVLSPLGWFLKWITRKKVVITAHGKDINFKSLFYQKTIIPFVKKMDKIICVSEQTKSECLARGVSAEKCTVIPNGIDFPAQNTLPKEELKERMEEKYKIKLKNRFIILTVGRLSRRKGVYWFIENVFPLLPDFVTYVVVGEDATEINDLKSWLGFKKAKYTDAINSLIKNKKLEKRVFLLGKISPDDLESFYQISDLFLMPNIKVEGDMEGFGIAAIEAASRSLPVVASKLEGIKEAIKDKKNGILVNQGNINKYKNTIEQLINSEELRADIGQRAKEYTRENFSWKNLTVKYQVTFENLCKK